jgi:hypothetical protein
MVIPSIPTFLDTQAFSSSCEAILIVNKPIEFKYPKKLHGSADCQRNWASCEDEIKKENNEVLKSLRNSANLYSLYSQEKSSNEWLLQYVGHSKKKDMRQRITAHLIKKNKNTGAQLEQIQKAVAKGCKIGVSFALVVPESMRLVAEELILNNKNLQLAWNTHR